MKMRATKSLTYRTRRMLPGDIFEVTRLQDVRILKAIRKAEEHVEIDDSPMSAPPIDPAPPAPPSQDPLDHDGDGHKGGSTAPVKTEDLAALRAEYKAVLDKQPFNGWSADELREKIAAHKATPQS